jgi:hypothetical protein
VVIYVVYLTDYWNKTLLDQHAELEFYSASSLRQQSAGRHVDSFEHII